MSNVSSYRKKTNRCDAVKVEDTDRKRTWRCNLVAGHAGRHESHSGHRMWD
jgi:hypothetical protein